MKKCIFLLLGLFTTSAIASTDCDRAMPMTKESVHLVVEALRLHKRDANYQEIGQWRSKIYVNEVFSYARGSATKESVNQQRTMINDAVGTIYRTCAPPKE